MAPELGNSSRYTKSCDVYSYGMIIYELIVLGPPSMSRKKIEEVLDMAPAPPLFIDLAQSCLSPHPEIRPPFEHVYEKLHSAHQSISAFAPDDSQIKNFKENSRNVVSESNLVTRSRFFTSEFSSRQHKSSNGKTSEPMGTHSVFFFVNNKRHRLVILGFIILILLGILIGLLIHFLRNAGTSGVSSSLSAVSSDSNSSSSKTASNPTAATSSSTTTATTTTAATSAIPTVPLQVGPSVSTGSFLDLCSSLSPLVYCNGSSIPAQINMTDSIGKPTIVSNCIFYNCPPVIASTPMIIRNVSFVNSSIYAAFRTSSSANFTNSAFLNCSSSVSTKSFQDFGYQDYNGYRGGSLHIDQGGTINLDGVVIRGSKSDQDGGSIYVNSYGTLSVSNSLITTSVSNLVDYQTNYVYGGGAIHLESNSSAVIMNTTISNCQGGAKQTSSYGGAIYANVFSTLTIVNSTIDSNIAWGPGGGGGIYCSGCGISVSQTMISNNYASYDQVDQVKKK